MQGNDSLRRGGYVAAFALGLIALFVWMTGNGWAAAGLVLAAMGVIAAVERLAERALRTTSPRLEESGCR